MKFIFIVNPVAGKGNVARLVQEAVGGRTDCEIYETRGPRDATAYIRHRCAEAPTEDACYVACGGDGTANEVASGVAGQPAASMTVFALGSGNDFVKAVGGVPLYRNVEALLAAAPRPIDILRVGDRWSINAFHFGFDASVARIMNAVKTKPIIGGRNAYMTGVVRALAGSMRTRCAMRVDGEDFFTGDMLLCTVANGQYVGGSYRCAPRSLQDDGLAEICLVKPVSRPRFVTLMSAYKNGTHLEDPRFTSYIQYRQGSVVEVEGGPDFAVSLDGEVVEGTRFRVEVVRQGLRFAMPQVRQPAMR